MTTFRPPGKFCPQAEENIAQAWKDWKQEFNLYLVADQKTAVSGETKVAMLLCSMGSQWIKVFNKFTFATAGDENKLEPVLAKFGAHFEPKKLLKGYITRFQQRVQGATESVADYIAAVRELASQCEFGDSEEQQVCVQISNGVSDRKLKDRLWEDDLTLDQVINQCNFHEQKEMTRRITGAGPSAGTESSVNTVGLYAPRGRGYSRGRGRGDGRHPGQGHYRNQGQQQGQEQHRSQRDDSARGRGGRGGNRGRGGYSESGQSCGNCGYAHGPRQCPAYNQLCHYCHKMGHFARCCQKTVPVHYASNDNQVHEYEEYGAVGGAEDEYESGIGMDTLSIHMVTKDVNVVSGQKSMWSVDLSTKCDGYISFKIDTGAECSLVSRATYESMISKPKLLQSNIAIRGLLGQPTKSLGTILLPVEYKGVEYDIRCEVLDGQKVPNILSEMDSVRMNLVKRVNVVDSVPKSASDVYGQYKDVFQGVGKIPGKYDLLCDPSAKPVAHPARPIPAALREPAREKLNQLESLGIIEKVPVGEPTAWCSAMHVVNKKASGPRKDVRITIDPKDLNKALLREYHPMCTIEEVATRTDKSKFFTVLDANMGYFQIELSEESQHLTAFNTPFGRYRYLRLPMGVSSAPEIYQRAMSEMFCDFEGVEIIMDDILIHAPTLELHNKRLTLVLQRCRDRNLKLNPRKTKLCAAEVEYIGHKLTADGVKISDEKVRAVLEMPEPASIAKVQTLLGMVTYTCKFLPHLSSVTEPLRQLIKESNAKDFVFHWDEVHRQAFAELKKLMTSAPVLKYYSLDEPITISCDASQSGLGAVLMQGGRPVAYASKALTNAEYAYAQIEKELLAIVFSFKKFHSYVYGRSDVTVETDHLPLVRIIEKPLHLVPLRLQKMRMTLQHHTFTLVGKSGKDIPVADALSRAFLPETCDDLMREVNYFNVYACEVRGTAAFSERRQKELEEASRNDPELEKVRQVVRSGWPKQRKELDPEIRKFYDSRDEIAVLDGIVFKADRVVIPSSMRSEMLKIIHEGHLGMVRSKQLARDVLYWPGMNAQIEDTVNNCAICQSSRRQQQREPLMSSEVPTGPWKVVAADLLSCVGSTFLVVIDYQSEFIEVEECRENTHSITIQEKLAKIFAVHGKPDKLLTDNGPQFASHSFREFANEWRFAHVTTSPYHHRANGMVERANQTVRHMLEKAGGDRIKTYYALLNFRNTPKTPESGSPAQRLFGRRTATKLPASEKLLKPSIVDPVRVQETLEKNRQTAQRYYNPGSKALGELRSGDTIRVRVGNRWRPAKLLPENQQPTLPRSYNLQTETGNIWRRNRHDILRTRERDIFNPEPREVHRPVDMDREAQPRQAQAVANPPRPNPPQPRQASPPRPNPPMSPPRHHQPSPPRVLFPVPNNPQRPSTPYVTRTGRSTAIPKRFGDYDMN